MKRKTYFILKHIPIVGDIIKATMDVPELYSNYMKDDPVYNEEIRKPFLKYLEKNPDIQPTRKLLNSFIIEQRDKNK